MMKSLVQKKDRGAATGNIWELVGYKYEDLAILRSLRSMFEKVLSCG